MMNKLIYIVVLLLSGCAIEDPSACFESGGKEISKTLALDEFSRVIVREGIALQLAQGDQNNLRITHAENFMDNITTEIVDGRLYISNNNECKFFNGYRPAQLLLTAKNITEIRNASQYTITNIDTLRYASLTLISEDFLEQEVNVGDFDLRVNAPNLSIITNDVSNFFLAGKVQNFDINFASGQGKLTASKLETQNIHLFHRGTNDLVVYPVQEIKGEIRGTGNVIAINRPPVIAVEEFYTGRLIFKN